MSTKVAPTQRALWIFLMTTFLAPFFAALIIFLASVIAGLIGRGPPSLLALDRAGQMHWASSHALDAYVWSALPAGLAGVALAGLYLWRGRIGWLECAVAGAVAATLFAVPAGGMVTQHLTAIAFIAATVGVILWALLTRAGILRA